MSLHKDIQPGFAFLIEVSVTYPFILVVMSSTDPTRGFVGFQAPFSIGLSVGVGLLMAVSITDKSSQKEKCVSSAALLQTQRENLKKIRPSKNSRS